MASLCIGLSFLALVGAQNQSSGELFWSYDKSPAVPAPPTGKGLGAWGTAYARAKDAIGRLSNEEKQNLTIGISSSTGCSGVSGGARSIEFPGLCLQDGPTGVRGTDLVTSFPSGLHIGASWNQDLAFEIARYMGAEFKRKGANVALGPVVGPLGRVAKGGRNWEGFTNDPFLAGKLVAPTIKGLQKSVVACVKHFIGNEQETNRNPSMTGFTTAVSSNIDDRTMHELYLWPFQDAVRAGVGSVMCSYNRVNNSYGCQNSKILNGLLKSELGFQGFVVSDWTAQHTGIASATAGLDMVMPDTGYWKDTLVNGVKNSSLSQARLDDMATRIIASWYLLDMDSASFPTTGSGLAGKLTAPHGQIDARDPASKSYVFQMAVEGQVLVKNENNALPFRSPKLLSLFGFDAPAPLANNPSGIQLSRWNLGATSLGAGDFSLLTSIATGNLPEVASAGTLSFGGGSGAGTGSYINSPFNAFDQKAYEDDIALHWDFTSQNPDVNPASDACVVFVNEFATEGSDRPGLADAGADSLIRNVAEKCKNTIVVIHGAGIRLVDNWIDHPNVRAVILAHLPGQDSGRALVEVMFGKQSPSGRLPYTLAKRDADYGSLLDPSVPGNLLSSTYQYPQSDFNETLYIDYRDFLKRAVTPRFEFGYGLTYTVFNYSSLSAKLLKPENSRVTPEAPLAEGGVTSLFENVASITFRVANTGSMAAAEVPQLYVGIPNAPSKQLRGFGKKLIKPGEAEDFQFDLTRRDLSVWDVNLQHWVLQKGEYKIFVGKSVLDTPLSTSLNV